MACIQGIKEDARLGAANLTDDDAIRPMAKSRFKQIREVDLALMSIELGLSGDDMRFPYMELSYIFENKDAIARRVHATGQARWFMTWEIVRLEARRARAKITRAWESAPEKTAS